MTGWLKRNNPCFTTSMLARLFSFDRFYHNTRRTQGNTCRSPRHTRLFVVLYRFERLRSGVGCLWGRKVGESVRLRRIYIRDVRVRIRACTCARMYTKRIGNANLFQVYGLFSSLVSYSVHSASTFRRVAFAGVIGARNRSPRQFISVVLSRCEGIVSSF